MEMQRSIHWPSCIDRHCPGCMPELGTVDRIDRKASEGKSVLIGHQRGENGGPCFCGWFEIGKSHAEHQVEMLVAEGVIT